jgi:hypothetical protein
MAMSAMARLFFLAKIAVIARRYRVKTLVIIVVPQNIAV